MATLLNIDQTDLFKDYQPQENINGLKIIPPTRQNKETILRSGDYPWHGIIVQEQVIPTLGLVNQKFPDHLHIIISIGRAINVEWKVEHTLQKKVYQIGDVGMIPQNYDNNTRRNKETKAVVILLENEFIETQLEINKFRLIPQRGISDQEINDISIKFKKQLDNLEMTSKIYADSLALSLAIQLSTKYSAVGKKLFAPTGKLSSTQLNHIIEFLHSFINRNIGLNDLAKQIHLSPFHFARLFKKTMGVPPHQYILQLRIEQAKLFLKNTRKSSTEIAYELGFTDLAHFSTALKKATGTSPGAFRKQEYTKGCFN